MTRPRVRHKPLGPWRLPLKTRGTAFAPEINAGLHVQPAEAEEQNALTIFTILTVLCLLRMLSSYTMGGAIHIVLVLAVIVLLFNVLGGRRALN